MSKKTNELCAARLKALEKLRAAEEAAQHARLAFRAADVAWRERLRVEQAEAAS